MARLTTVGGSFAGHVLAARLEAEGITVRLRGAVDSPYQFTVGDMGRVHVFVPEDEMDDARLVLLVDEVDATLDLPPQHDRPRGAGLAFEPYAFWVVLVAIAMLGIIPIARMAFGA